MALAISNYSKAIQYSQTNYMAYFYRGNAYCGLREWTNAISDFTESIRLEPKNAMAFANRSYAYLGLGNARIALF